MKIRRYLAAVLAAAGLTAAAAMLPSAAHAATPSCGASCINIYSAQFEGPWPAHHPQFVMDVQGQTAAIGQHVILFRASNSDPGEDFTVASQGTVHDFFTANMVSAAFNLHFGTDQAYEIEYSPYGVDSGLCVGVPGTAVNGTKVSLQPCGVTAATVWAADFGSLAGGFGPTPAGYVVVINGTDTNFSHPYALNYPNGAYPTDNPRPQFQTWQVQHFAPGQVYDNELYSAKSGPLF